MLNKKLKLIVTAILTVLICFNCIVIGFAEASTVPVNESTATEECPHTETYVCTIIAASCKKEGVQLVCCSDCKAVLEEVVVPKTEDHELRWTMIKNPTIEEDGEKALQCQVCHKIFETKTVPARGKHIISVEMNDMEIYYKYYKPQYAYCWIGTLNGAKYTKEFVSSDPSIVSVDNKGRLYGHKIGTATVTCIATDEFGNVLSDSGEITVKYAWWQWIIKVVLLGWIWY